MTTETTTENTTSETTRPSDEVEIFSNDPSTITDLDADTLEKGFQPNQVISAGEFNKMMSQVQKWTEYLEVEEKTLDQDLSSLETKHTSLQARWDHIEQELPSKITIKQYREFYQTMALEGYAKAFEKFELVDDEVLIVFDDPTHPHMPHGVSQKLYHIADKLWDIWDADKLWYTYRTNIFGKSVNICKSNNRSKTIWRSIYDGLRSFNGEPSNGRFIKKESLLYLNSRELKWIVLNNDQSYYDAFEDEYKYYLDKPGSYSFPNGYVLPKLKGIKSA